jgi:two-component sensor histidine kinase
VATLHTTDTHPTTHGHDRFALKRAEIGLIAGFWLAYAMLTIGTRLIDRGSQGFRGLSGFAEVSIFESFVWAALTIPVFALAARIVSIQRRWVQVVIVVAAGLLLSYVVGGIGREIRQVLTPFPQQPAIRVATDTLRGGPQGPRGPRGGTGVPIFAILGAYVLYMGVFAAGLARVFSRRYQLRREQAARNEARLEAQLVEARLDALRRQLDPHFLFNTLNAVSALLERDPRGVRRMISRLSELLRYSFEGGNEAEVTLRDELQLLTRYVDIMQVRFQGRLTVETEIVDAALDALVPTMVLQPIVENAIKHGIEKNIGEGTIEITASVENDLLVIDVIDNGPGLSDQRRDGIGVRNTRARLEELYRSGASFSLQSAAGSGTLAQLRIPFHTRSRLARVS